jgi:hypothetical protein
MRSSRITEGRFLEKEFVGSWISVEMSLRRSDDETEFEQNSLAPSILKVGCLFIGIK